jgi:hypothetical protein
MTLERSEVAEGWEDLGVELAGLDAGDYGLERKRVCALSIPSSQ